MPVVRLISVVAIHQLSGPASARPDVPAATTAPTIPRARPATTAATQTAATTCPASQRDDEREGAGEHHDPDQRAQHARGGGRRDQRPGERVADRPAAPHGRREPHRGEHGDDEHDRDRETGRRPGAAVVGRRPAGPNRWARAAAAATSGPTTRPLAPAQPLVVTANCSADQNERCGPTSGSVATNPVAAAASAKAPTVAAQATTKVRRRRASA